MADDKNKQLFLSLIYSFQMQTMMQLGKLANPMSGTIERELDGAQITIDMLDMLKAKTKGNINEDENKFLDQIIADLKLNFVEERDKEKTETKEIKDEKPQLTDVKQEVTDSVNNEDKKQDSDKDKKVKQKADTEKDDSEPLPPQE